MAPPPKMVSGSSSSRPEDPRPRAQVAYEGEDEFSAMSLDPERRKSKGNEKQLAPSAPGERDEVRVHELKSTNENGIVGFFRKIFAK